MPEPWHRGEGREDPPPPRVATATRQQGNATSTFAFTAARRRLVARIRSGLFGRAARSTRACCRSARPFASGRSACGSGSVRRLATSTCRSTASPSGYRVRDVRRLRGAARRRRDDRTDYATASPVAVERHVEPALRAGVPRASPARRRARARARRCSLRGGSSRAGGRSRTPSGRRAAAERVLDPLSVPMSTDEVASSRMRMRGSASSARAKARAGAGRATGGRRARPAAVSYSSSSSRANASAPTAWAAAITSGSAVRRRRRCSRAACRRRGTPPAARCRAAERSEPASPG